MNSDDAAKDIEVEETMSAEEGEADDSMRQLITLALMAVAVIAFLAFCLPTYIL